MYFELEKPACGPHGRPRPAPRRSYVRVRGRRPAFIASSALVASTSLHRSCPSCDQLSRPSIVERVQQVTSRHKPQCGVRWSCYARSEWAPVARGQRRRQRRRPRGSRARPPPTRCCCDGACCTTCSAPRSATPSPPTTSARCSARSRRTCAASSPSGC